MLLGYSDIAAAGDYGVYIKSDKTRSTGSLTVIITCIFSSCTIGVVTKTTLNSVYRKRCGGGVASSGACPAPVPRRVFIIHPSCLRACVCACHRRTQWKRLARRRRRRRPLVPIRPCKVSGARLMKTLLPGKTIRVGLYYGRRAGVIFFL